MSTQLEQTWNFSEEGRLINCTLWERYLFQYTRTRIMRCNFVALNELSCFSTWQDLNNVVNKLQFWITSQISDHTGHHQDLDH